MPAKVAILAKRLVAKTKPELVTLRRSRTLVQIETANFVFTSKLIDASYPDYQRIVRRHPKTPLPSIARNFSLRLAVLLQPRCRATPPNLVALQWKKVDDALSLFLPQGADIGSDALAAEASGAGCVVAPIGQLIALIEALPGERITLDHHGNGGPIRITVVGELRSWRCRPPAIGISRSNKRRPQNKYEQTNKT